MKKNSKTQLIFPKTLLEPIRKFLEIEIAKLKRTERKIKAGDPFRDPTRVNDNSVEEDVSEQVGHLETQVKAGFVKKQLVQMRKALTMIKIGKYGICESCGKMIDTDRLAIRPEATVCIKCEREAES